MVDKNTFFYEVTTRICGSLHLEQAAMQTLRYLYGVLPAENIVFALLDQESGMYKIVVHASLSEGHILNETLDLSHAGWDRIHVFDRHAVITAIEADRDPVMHAVKEKLKLSATYAAVMPLSIDNSFDGVCLIITQDRIRNAYELLPMLDYISVPFSMAFSNFLAYQELEEQKQAAEQENRSLRRLLESNSQQVPTLHALNSAAIVSALEKTKGKISGPGGAAELLGVHPNTLRSRMEKLGVHYKK